MICKDTFDAVCEKARGYKYSSMNWIDYDDCKNAKVLHDCDDYILMHDSSKTPAMLYFAANNFEELISIIAEIPGKLRLHFVPREFAARLSEAGFNEWAEFTDFWNTDITRTASFLDSKGEADYLKDDECEEALMVFEKCVLQSRGFEGVSLKDVSKYMEEGEVIVCRKDSSIVGFCSVSIINEGTTLWVRVIAVDPAHQGHGIGKNLMEQAIKYGSRNRTAKGFLSADKLNYNAIGLFNKYDFHAKESESELIMIRAKCL